MDKAFEVKNVRKYFGEVKALDGVSLSAKPGTIFGLLGPNGAGKTTLVRMLSTLLDPDKGSAKVLGLDVVEQPDKVREIIGLAGQYAAVDEYMTGRENLHMVGTLYHLPKREYKVRANELLERLSLSEAADRPVRTYSGGMRRRLDLGASLIGHPKVLFLDEPTTGLDPRTRLELWHIIRELVGQGTSILLTTQYLEEADTLADRVAVIDRGKVIIEGTTDQLKNQLGGDVIELEVPAEQQAQALEAVKSLGTKQPTINETGGIVVPVKEGKRLLVEVVRAIDSAKLSLDAIALHRPSLDDVFLAVTGKRVSTSKSGKKKRGKQA